MQVEDIGKLGCLAYYANVVKRFHAEESFHGEIFLPRLRAAIEEEDEENTSHNTPNNQQPFQSRSQKMPSSKAKPDHESNSCHQSAVRLVQPGEKSSINRLGL